MTTERNDIDVIDARRWRAVRARHAMALCRLATGSSGYSSAKAPGLLDAWADMAAAEVEAFDPEQWAAESREQASELFSESGRSLTDEEAADCGLLSELDD